VKQAQENLGPSEEADAEFAKELAKMMTDQSAESRKVDRRTAQALWESAVLPPGIRKKRVDEEDEEAQETEAGQSVMNFTMITKRGNKQQVLLTHLRASAVALTPYSRRASLPFLRHLHSQFRRGLRKCRTRSSSSTSSD